MCGVRATWLVGHSNSNEGGWSFAKGQIEILKRSHLWFLRGYFFIKNKLNDICNYR